MIFTATMVLTLIIKPNPLNKQLINSMMIRLRIITYLICYIIVKNIEECPVFHLAGIYLSFLIVLHYEFEIKNPDKIIDLLFR